MAKIENTASMVMSSDKWFKYQFENDNKRYGVLVIVFCSIMAKKPIII
jgi:hypothetical protein